MLVLVVLYLCGNVFAKIDVGAPMVHQRWDTKDSFDGSWACGPTSTVMAVARFSTLPPHPINVSSPTPHRNDYGYYVSEIYTFKSTTFNHPSSDAAGKTAYGAYGWCREGEQGTMAYLMQDYAKRHGLHSDFYATATFDKIKELLLKNHLVVLDTKMSSAGHIILVRGIDDAGNLICNDPYGNADGGSYGRKTDGEGVHYTWQRVAARWMIDVYA